MTEILMLARRWSVEEGNGVASNICYFCCESAEPKSTFAQRENGASRKVTRLGTRLWRAKEE
jgi:hypothetical protein